MHWNSILIFFNNAQNKFLSSYNFNKHEMRKYFNNINFVATFRDGKSVTLYWNNTENVLMFDLKSNYLIFLNFRKLHYSVHYLKKSFHILKYLISSSAFQKLLKTALIIKRQQKTTKLACFVIVKQIIVSYFVNVKRMKRKM